MRKHAKLFFYATLCNHKFRKKSRSPLNDPIVENLLHKMAKLESNKSLKFLDTLQTKVKKINMHDCCPCFPKQNGFCLKSLSAVLWPQYAKFTCLPLLLSKPKFFIFSKISHYTFKLSMQDCCPCSPKQNGFCLMSLAAVLWPQSAKFTCLPLLLSERKFFIFSEISH